MTSTAPAGAGPATSWKDRFTVYCGKYSTIAILVLIGVVFSILEPAFIRGDNTVRIVEQGSITILLALGEFFAILLAGIDLSVGSVMALTGVITAKMMVAGTPWPLAILLGVLAGALIGLFNGALITVTKLPPFIITLGTMAILRGMTYVLSDARAVSGVPPQFSNSIGGRLFDVIPIPIVVVAVVAVLLIFFTTKAKAGRNLYAMGGNEQAADDAGLNIGRHTLLAFTISRV